MAVISACTSAAIVAAHLAEGDWQQALEAGLIAGLGSILIFIFLFFLKSLLDAPRRVRRIMASPPGIQVLGTLTGTVRVSDVMQQHAGRIASEIGDYLDRQNRTGSVPQPHQIQIMRQHIAYFGERIEEEAWITRKSRRRSRELYSEIFGSSDLEFIRDRCRAFVRLKPLL